MSSTGKPLQVLAQPELDLWALKERVEQLVFRISSRTIGDLSSFSCILTLDVALSLLRPKNRLW